MLSQWYNGYIICSIFGQDMHIFYEQVVEVCIFIRFLWIFICSIIEVEIDIGIMKKFVYVHMLRVT